MTDGRTRAVEAMASVDDEHACSREMGGYVCTCGWLGDSWEQFGRHVDERKLDAALAVRDEKVCETCEGRGWVGEPTESLDPRKLDPYSITVPPCPDCSNGTVPGPTLLTWRVDL